MAETNEGIEMADVNAVQVITGGVVAILVATVTGGAKWLYGFFRETREAQSITDRRLVLLEKSMNDSVQDHVACAHSIASMVRDSEARQEKVTEAIFHKLDKFDEAARELSVSVAELRVEIRNGKGSR